VTQYLLRRVVAMIPMLLGVTFLSFMIMNFAPGDPTTIYLDPTKPFSQEEIEMIKKDLGLDQSLMVRYVKWLGRTLQGDLGFSFVSRRPVIKEIAERLPNTILLAITTMTISFVVGSLVGIYTALNQYKVSDYVVTVLAFLCSRTR
jgi:peptide/nickel transport system permease protein